MLILFYGSTYVTNHDTETGFCEGKSCLELEAQQNPQLEQETIRSSGMEWRSHGRDNNELVSQLKRNKIIKTQRVEDAMRKVDRGNYCDFAPYMDSPQSIGYGVTISAPHMHGHALEMLKDHLFEGAKALDVGSGMPEKLITTPQLSSRILNQTFEEVAKFWNLSFLQKHFHGDGIHK